MNGQYIPAAIAEEIMRPKELENPVVITSGKLSGLGDHAIWTTLPERFSKLGYDVYLDKDNFTNNREVFELLWERNPFIKGLSERKPNAGRARQGLFYEIANRLAGCRSIEAMERAHALPPPYSMAPKIYYEPKNPIIDVRGKILCDFSSVSSKIGNRGLEETFRMMRGKFRSTDFLQIIHRKNISLNSPGVGGSGIEVQSIYEYMDLLYACRAWVGSEAGGQSLASAVRGEHEVYEDNVRPEVVCVITPPTYNSRGYTYRNVDYRVTGDTDTSRDYHDPVEVKELMYENNCMMRMVKMGRHDVH